MKPIVIIGGGISGLSTAYYLSKAGVPVKLIEQDTQLGGFLQTEIVDGCVIEYGPDSFINSKPWARELIEELGIGDQIIGSKDHLRATYIWRRGRMIKMPEGLTLMVPARLGPVMKTSLLGWGSKLRMLAEMARRPPKHQEDRSVAEFVKDHYGQEVVDYLAEPLLAGVYGGDITQLSAASVLPRFVAWEAQFGSISRGAMKVPASPPPLFGTLKQGFGQLIAQLKLRTQAEIIHGKVEKIEKGFRIRVNGDWITADRLVIACKPELVLPNLFPPMLYSSSTVVAVLFNKSEIQHPLNGFGFLVPKKERKSISACTWVGTKFDHRVPADKVLLRCFVNGDVNDVLPELQEKMGIKARPILQRVIPWPASMPQYTVGHAARMQLIEDMLKDFSGLHLVGNAYYGLGIPDCIRMAKEVAARIITSA